MTQNKKSKIKIKSCALIFNEKKYNTAIMSLWEKDKLYLTHDRSMNLNYSAKLIETEDRMVGSRGWEEGQMGRCWFRVSKVHLY